MVKYKITSGKTFNSYNDASLYLKNNPQEKYFIKKNDNIIETWHEREMIRSIHNNEVVDIMYPCADLFIEEIIDENRV